MRFSWFRTTLHSAGAGCLLLASGCAEGGPAEMDPAESDSIPAEVVRAQEPGERFPGSAASLSDLGEAAFGAMQSRDREALAGWRLTEAEHNEVVFPELPAGQESVGYPVDLAWQNIELRNGRALERQFSWFRDRVVEYVSTECRGETQGFRTFVVHTDCHVIFNAREGRGLEVQLFEEVLERGGGFKIFRYHDDPPRAGTTG